MAPGELLPAGWPQHLASVRVLRPCHLPGPTCWAAQARAVRGLEAGEVVSEATQAVSLSIHLSSPLTKQGSGGDAQTQVPQSEKPSLEEEASRTRDLPPGKTQAQTGPGIGQAKVRGGSERGRDWLSGSGGS